MLNEILTRVANALEVTDTSEIELTSLKLGLTNQSLLARVGDSRYVVRLNNPRSIDLGIVRKNESFNLQLVSKTGIFPSLIFNDEMMIITEFVEGQRFSMSSHQSRRALGIALKKVNTLPTFRGIFCPFAAASNYLAKSKRNGFYLPAMYSEIEERMNEVSLRYYKLELDLSPSHCDLTKSNILQHEDKLWILDWEYSSMSDKLYDLAKIAVSTNLIEETFCRKT